MPLIPALERQRQTDLCEVMVSLVYTVSSRIASVTQRNHVLKNKNNNNNKNKYTHTHTQTTPFLLEVAVVRVFFNQRTD